MLAAVVLQCVATVVGALLAWVIGDAASARSFLLGSAAATIPNGLFALRLALHRNKPAETYPVVFALGELIKIGLTIGLLGLIVKTQTGLDWLALILGLIVALKVTLFALLVPGRAGLNTQH